MRRVDATEILDTDGCTPAQARATLRVIGRVNRWFGGISTTQKMVERVAETTGTNHLSLLEVAAGLGGVPHTVQKNLENRGITLRVTLLDLARSHLPAGDIPQCGQPAHCVVANALDLPFADGSFDLVSCSLFAHHLNPQQLCRFMKEGLRVSRRALLINDLVRHPLHLFLVYVSYPIMLDRVAWLDGLTSVRRAYQPSEMRIAFNAAYSSSSAQMEISRHYLFRMGLIAWKIRSE